MESKGKAGPSWIHLRTRSWKRFRMRGMPLRMLLSVLIIGAVNGFGATEIKENKETNKTNKAVRTSWWSLQPVKTPELLPGSTSNPIDSFIETELRERDLKAVGPAEKSVLLRRVFLDLIGLPPSPEEVEAFVRDTSPDAYEKLTDRLLAQT